MSPFLNKLTPLTPFAIRLNAWADKVTPQTIIIWIAFALAVAASGYTYMHGYTIAYGDAESHLNIAKRITDSLTPGFAQLGGIWLPLPHLLLLPFVSIDVLWRTGLAGSIVSGAAYIISSVFLYKITFLLTKNQWASFVASLIFLSNPNILYLQSTPMTEMVLIMFFCASTFYFLRFLNNHNDLTALIASGLFSFGAALSRYDGWFLIFIQAMIILFLYIPVSHIPKSWKEFTTTIKSEEGDKLLGRLILYCGIALFAILLWLGWDWIILGDPLYFIHSPFSASSQQNHWRSLGQLPGYHNLWSSFLYYLVTAWSNAGVLVFAIAAAGLAWFCFIGESRHRLFIGLLLCTPFLFNVCSLFLGQSIIFIPELTPEDFQWRLFNVRYGAMAIPLIAVFTGYFFFRATLAGKLLLITLFIIQCGWFAVGLFPVITLEDGIKGLSSAIVKQVNAQDWMKEHYDNGLVLMDDYARTFSIIRTGIPIKNIIYIGNKPYWPESLKEPEKYARWIVMQKNDAVWRALYENPELQGRLYKYFAKAYTSPEILVFVRADTTQKIELAPLPATRIRGYEKSSVATGSKIMSNEIDSGN